MAVTQANPVSRGDARLGGASPDVAGILRSEWTKIRSVRSTYWTLLVTLIAAVGLAILISWGTAHSWDQATASQQSDFDPTNTSLAGLFFGQLAIAVFGVMVITAEYSTGMIRTTLWAVPRRGLVLASKAAVAAAVTFVVGAIASFGAFFVAQPFFAGKHIEAHIGDPGVLRAIFGGPLYLVVLVLLAVGIGTILRSTPGGVVTVVGILFVIPIIAAFLPQSWKTHINKFLPSEAGQQIMAVHHSSDSLAPWAGIGVFAIYAVVALVVATLLIRHRDA